MRTCAQTSDEIWLDEGCLYCLVLELFLQRRRTGWRQEPQISTVVFFFYIAQSVCDFMSRKLVLPQSETKTAGLYVACKHRMRMTYYHAHNVFILGILDKHSIVTHLLLVWFVNLPYSYSFLYYRLYVCIYLSIDRYCSDFLLSTCCPRGC